MAETKILLPYNFTANDRKALDFVIRTFSHQRETEVTLFNAYTPPPRVDTRKETVMKRMEGTLRSYTTLLKEQEAVFAEVRQALVDSGFSENGIQLIFRPLKRDVAGDIIELAWEGRFHTIVLNRKPGRITRFFTGSVFSKVVTALKDTVVCIVS